MVWESEGEILTDYKRMISYMYQYENGVKKSNVGYARIEAKNKQCKITLHMQLLGQSDSVFPTYLIHRENGHLELIYIGDSLLKSQVMDSKLTADEDSVMGSGYTLSDMGGLLIFLNNNVFFASGWDDKPIISRDLLDAMKPRTKRYDNNSISDKSVDAEANNIEKAVIESIRGEAGKKDIQDTFRDPEGVDITESIPDIVILEEELKIPKYELPRGWKTVEMFLKPINIEENCPDEIVIKAAKIDPEDQIEQQEVRLPEILPVIEENTPGMENEITAAEDYDYTDNEETIEDPPENENEEDQDDNQVVKHFFDNYPRIYPFEDNEIKLCVKIEPKDIGLLPKETWSLSNNSFLMHGFYCYHHLIFAKMKDMKDSYILGVPGIYHNREQFMARMFGFEHFKSIRKRDIKQGDFGYWYLPIKF